MFYSDDVIQEVREQNDIVAVVGQYVPLRARGGRHWGLCPFHQENTASFSVNAETQYFHCFGCGAGGNVLTFVMRMEHLGFVDALKRLADRVHFMLPQPGNAYSEGRKHKQRLQIAEFNKLAARFFYDSLRSDTSEARDARVYLRARGVSDKLAAQFGLGLAPAGWNGLMNHLTAQGATAADLHTAGLLVRRDDDTTTRYYDRFRGRLMFPIIDTAKRVVGFGGRTLKHNSEEAKYINSPETPLFNKSNQLYALNVARQTRSHEYIVVEGYMDALALHKAGFVNTVGVLGTALTARHANLLKHSGCVTALLLLDSDTAGTQAALKSIPILTAGGLRVKVLQVPDAKDPDEYLQKYGAEKLGELLANAKSHITFQINLLREKFDMEKTDERVLFTQEAAALLATLASEIETSAYVQETAATAHIAEDAIFAEIKKQREISARRGTLPAATPRVRIPRSDEPGLHKARKNLLFLALTKPNVALSLQDKLSPEEMGNDVMAWLLSYVYQNATDTQIGLDSNVLTDFFDTDEEKNQVRDIFSKPDDFAQPIEIERAVNDFVRRIKSANQKNQLHNLEGTEQENLANSIGIFQKTLQNQYITLTNG